MAEISRKQFLRFAGLGLAASTLAGCGVLKNVPTTNNVANRLATVVVAGQAPVGSPGALAIATVRPTNGVEGFNFAPAQRNGDKWLLHDSDNNQVAKSLPEGFTPDRTLNISNDISPQKVLPVPQDANDFQQYLNSVNNPLGIKLAGYMYGTNDYNQYEDGKSRPQLPMYSWLVHTGEIVDIPGIGRVEGGPGKAAMVLIINRTDKVYQWPLKSVYVKSGFQGAGRIWNGEAKPVSETEKRLTQHYLSILGHGHPESGFIGQCDLKDNCNQVNVVTAERIQWGNNADGSPRFQFRLIRAETLPAAK